MKASFALMSSPPTERKKPRPCAEPPPPPSDVCCPGAAAPVRPPRPAAARSPRPSPRPPARAAMSSAASGSPPAQPQRSPASPPPPKGAQPPAPYTAAKTAASSASSSHPSRSVGTLPAGPESGSKVSAEDGVGDYQRLILRQVRELEAQRVGDQLQQIVSCPHQGAVVAHRSTLADVEPIRNIVWSARQPGSPPSTCLCSLKNQRL